MYKTLGIVIIFLVSIVSGYYLWQFGTFAATTLFADKPDFQADLKNTLELQAGVGVPTFTRSDTGGTGTYRASVTDFEGLIKPVKNGEARFEGARRVENFLVSSKADLTTGWNNYSSCTSSGINTGTIDPLGGQLATTITATSPNAALAFADGLHTTVATFASSLYLRRRTGTGTIKIFDPTGAEIDITSQLTSSWKRFSTSGGTLGSNFNMGVRIVTSGDAVDMAFPMFESVVGQANQNPSEYVSVGAKSAPYHGAGVDGVKYFSTKNGNTVASNVVTEATGATIPDATLHGYVEEGSRVNQAIRSSTLNTGWSTGSTTVSPDVVVSPDGSLSADLMYPTSSGSNRWIYQAYVAANSVWTRSIYAKAQNKNILYIDATGAGTKLSFFNLSNGTVGTVDSGYTATMTSVGNGWYRCTVTDNVASVNLSFSGVYGVADADGSTSVTANSTDGIYLWGAQFEVGPFASSYIPTTTGAVTRGSDVLKYPFTNNADNANGTAYAEVVPKLVTSASLFPRIISTTNNGGGAMLYIQGSSNKLGIYDNTLEKRSSNTINQNVTNKVASKWNSSTSALSLNGILTGSLAFDGSLNFADIAIGNDNLVNDYWYGTIRNVKIWKKALSDTQLTNMTSTNAQTSANAVRKTTVVMSQNTKLTDGLVGLWSFNGLDVSGTTAYDRSGSGNHSTMFGGVSKTIGKVGQGLQFDGVTGYATVPSKTLWDFTNTNLTLSFWVYNNANRQSSDASAPLQVGKMLYNTVTVYWSFGTTAGGVVDLYYYNGQKVHFTGTTVLPLKTWELLTLVKSGTSLKMYINGALENSGTVSGTPQTDTTTPLTFGALENSYYSGSLDEVRLSNRALSATEIKQLYDLGR